MMQRSFKGSRIDPLLPDARRPGRLQSTLAGKRRRRTQGRVWAVHIDLDQATDLVRQTLVLALLVSTPMLAIGLIVGIVVSLFQAVTQIQEQTLTFVPKIVAMVAAAIFLFPWMGHAMVEYASQMFGHGIMR
jgi:flagellar biosynthetic protein FliQ